MTRTPDRVYRVVQWTTGNVARQTVRAILRRPDLELVGCYAWSKDKVGQDVAALVRLEEPCGITATDDVEALIGLRPDCVVYTPLKFQVAEVERLLRAGINVVTSAEFQTGHSITGARQVLSAAGEAGGASLFGSGMNPGYAQLLGAVATSVCHQFRHVRATESVDVSSFASDGNQDDLGWGRPMGDPGHEVDVHRAVAVFEDGAHLLADCLGLELEDVTCRIDFAAAKRDLDLAGRFIPEGGVAGIDIRFGGVVGGREVLELHQRWVMDADVEPSMPVTHGYRIEVDGSPQVTLELGLLPDQPFETLDQEDLHDIGMTITGLPVLNAIPHTVAARPGIVTYADIPVPTAALAEV